MAIQYPSRPAIPRYESSLAAFMPAFEAGQKARTDANAFDAAAKAFGGGAGAPQKPASPLEQLMGLVTGKPAAQPQQGPFTRPQTALGAIDAAAPNGLPSVAPSVPLPADIPENAWQTVASIPTTGGAIPQGYMASARASESGGNDAARNPNSTATGRYQFLESTWNGLAQQYPELGLTPDGRTDPAQQERAMAQFTQDNARALSSAGIPVDPGTLYAAHFLGAGGAQKALTANPATPMSALVEPGVIQANPQLANMSAGEFAQWAQIKGGNSSGGYQPPMRDVGAGQGKPFQVDEGTMRTLLASEATRPLAVSLIQAQQETQSSQGRFVTEEGADGSIWQRDTLTGEQKVIREAPQAVEAPKREIRTGPDGMDRYVDTGEPVFPDIAPAIPAPDFDDVTKLRTEIQSLPSYKNIAQATPIYKSMVETAGRDSRASDLNLVYGLGKIMDPTSVVREGEMFMVQGINTLPDKLIEGVNSLLTGSSTLSPDTRQAILTEAYGRMSGYESQFNADVGQYQGIVERNQMNPADVIPSFDEITPWTPVAALPAGVTEEDIAHTMQLHGVTREQVLERLNATP